MLIGKRLRGRVLEAYLGGPGTAVRRAVNSAKRAVRRQELALDLAFDPADPWSYLAAQVVDRLATQTQLPVQVRVITPPASDVDPQPAMRTKYAVRDAQLLASQWDLEFAGKREADPGAVEKVATALIRERPGSEQLACALELAGAMWRGDGKALAAGLGRWGTESAIAVAPHLATAYEQLRSDGHYQGGMIGFAGEWYWGVDRLWHLERAIAEQLGRPVTPVLQRRADAPVTTTAADTVELWFSFRSPYSYLALARLDEVVQTRKLKVQLRPLAPMVERGAKLPTDKKMYIARDAKREADRLGIPFGNLCDPLGQGVRNCLALCQWADGQGKALAFAQSAMRGIWAEARDLTEYVDLKAVVERAGLDWSAAQTVLSTSGDNPAVTAWTKTNLADLTTIGLWGVPSYRCGDFVAWGNDRLEHLPRHVDSKTQ